MNEATHQNLILDQFTRQAAPFSAAAMIKDEAVLRLIVEAASPQPDDTVLDVACGPGLVVCAFAPRVRQATGIDLTPAMLEEARKAAAQRRLRNVALDRGDVYALPYDKGSFSIVIARYAFHHLLDPLAALRRWPGFVRRAVASSLSMPMRLKTRRRRPSTTASSGSAILLMPGH